ncbi:glycosidase [Halobacteroides halobius DSM 5150]|uniref:Glycosidase n=1 Tax=Halobacteroides halobius (strain ATCC 35273 / DSM 5150 / MD-1) TaxID=748449 RepID=L0KBS8_HALHC|nr:glycoside hydrolase family 13 protein [Halobacteroides halobius]AGB42005.1 glycosidase [Halobacteroides halobius DSM 5150]
MFINRKKFTIVVLVTLLIMVSTFSFAQVKKRYQTVVLRGSLAPLDWSSNDNPLTYNQSTKTWQSNPIQLTGGKTLQFKYVYDDQWMPGGNLKFTPPQSGKYVFKFHPQKERKVDVQLVSQYQGQATLQVTVPSETPQWTNLTLGSSLNNFNYTITKLKRKKNRVWTIKLSGKPGEKFTYQYALNDKKYLETRKRLRQATFTKENKVYTDRVVAWEKIPVAKSVTHDFSYQPSIPNSKEEVQIRVTVKHYGNIDTGGIYYTTDGSAPVGKRGTVKNGQFASLQITKSTTKGKITKSTLTGTIPAQENRTPVKYIIDVWDKQSQGSQFADTNSLTPQGATEFAYYVDNYQTPDWAKDAIIYQVFVDRFRNGNPNNDKVGVDQLPYSQQLKKWMGGDLVGLKEKLDYIDKLGVNAIWISPVYKGPYSHGYHPASFKKIDPHFGNKQIMKEIVKAAHKRGIKIIYDFVANHSSNRHPFFQSALEKGKRSKYYDWYTFTDWPNKYETFYSIKELPEFNNNNYQARNYMLNEVVAYWLNEIGIDGFRLDYAKGPSYSFWVDFRHKVKSIKPNAYIFGEVWADRKKINSYAGELDGAVGFEMQGAFYDTFIKDKSMAVLNKTVEQNQKVYPDEYVINTFLDSHDMPRFIFEAGNNPQILKLAAAAQFTLPGTPIIYYGDEIALSQSGDHNKVNTWKDRYYREPMPWDKEKQHLEKPNLAVKAYYKKLIKLRNQEIALRRGNYQSIHVAEDILVFARTYKGEKIIVMINKGKSGQSFSVQKILKQKLNAKDAVVNLMTDQKLTTDREGNLILHVAPQTVGIYELN